MADFRQIHTSIWDDDWFCQLSSDDKVVFVWLFSNRRASVSGLYQFSEFICARETGLTMDVVKQSIKRLSDDKKIYVEGEWVWVKNLRKYNYYKNGNADKRIQTDLDQLPDNGLKKAYIEYYKPLDSPYKAPSIPLPEQEQEQEHDIEHENEQEQEHDKFSGFDDIQKTLEQLTGQLPNGDKAVKAINDILEMGATRRDVKEGIKWLNDNGKTVRYYNTVVNPTRTAMSIRLQKKQEVNRYEGAKVYE